MHMQVPLGTMKKMLDTGGWHDITQVKHWHGRLTWITHVFVCFAGTLFHVERTQDLGIMTPELERINKIL